MTKKILNYALGIAVLSFSVGESFAVDFPKVSPAVQKERDQTRAEILQVELADEQKRLAAASIELAQARKANAPSTAIATLADNESRSKANVAALARELQQTEKLVNQPAAQPPVLLVATRAPESTPAAQIASNQPAPYWDVFRRKKEAK